MGIDRRSFEQQGQSDAGTFHKNQRISRTSYIFSKQIFFPREIIQHCRKWVLTNPKAPLTLLQLPTREKWLMTSSNLKQMAKPLMRKSSLMKSPRLMATPKKKLLKNKSKTKKTSLKKVRPKKKQPKIPPMPLWKMPKNPQLQAKKKKQT